MSDITIYYGDNLKVLDQLDPCSLDLVYIDPPFNTGHNQVMNRQSFVKDVAGNRIGFNDDRYSSLSIGKMKFTDIFDDYHSFLYPRLELIHLVLKKNGSLFFHIDYRESRYCGVILDKIFGRRCFMNEIIWSYDYGARSRKRWSTKHDSILWYAKDPNNYIFNYDSIDRIPYMAPSLVSEEKRKRGKTPTDVWWNTIVPTNSTERTGYPTQKPLQIINRIVRVHSNSGDTIADFFAGSGTLGQSALNLDRNAILVDNNTDAIRVMRNRLGKSNVTVLRV